MSGVAGYRCMAAACCARCEALPPGAEGLGDARRQCSIAASAVSAQLCRLTKYVQCLGGVIAIHLQERRRKLECSR